MSGDRSLADATRKELRNFLRLDNERPGGGRFTKPAPDQIRADRRKKNKVSKAARKTNR